MVELLSLMSTSIRKEVLEQLYIQIQERGIVPLSNRDQFKANKTRKLPCGRDHRALKSKITGQTVLVA